MSLQKLIIPVVALFSAGSCFAQDTTIYFIPAGTSIVEKLGPKQFKYPQFKDGKVQFKDGSVAASKLNYGFLSGEIEFIGPSNDTMAISDDKTPLIKQILIDTDIFCFNKDYYQEIANQPELGRLLKKDVFGEMYREKRGAYDQASPTGAVQTFGSVAGSTIHSIVDGLIAKEDIYLKITTEYFIENKDFDIEPANKKNLLRLFPSKRKVINDYLSKTPVNFNNEAELKQLFNAIK